MESKELIRQIKYNEMLSPETCKEIIQRLMEYDEMKRLAMEVAEPLLELYNFLLGLEEDFQAGDIKYGRKE